MSTNAAGELHWWWLEFRDLWLRRWWLICLILLTALVFSSNGWVLTVLALVVAAAVGAKLRKRYAHGRTLADHARARWERSIVAHVSNLWLPLMDRLGCSIQRFDGGREIPGLRQFSWIGDSLRLNVTIPLGMTRQQLAAVAPAIAENLGAWSAHLADAPGGAVLWIDYTDRLAEVITLPIAEAVDLRSVPLGIREDGYLWAMRLGPHTLVAGSSGSGKASLVWGLILGLAPAIKSGLVQVHGIDLKSAMELGMGRPLLTRFADSADLAVQLLEEAVSAMERRAHELSGTTRQHTPTVESPHVVILIDEMAALTAYQTDRELLRRANAALALLCSQGRAVGYTVFACLQDPRKETLPMRGLFTQTIGLRLRDAMETAMVLGEGMRDKGALCHKIAATTPGVGYVIPEDGGDPVRVRAGNVTDDMIQYASWNYPAPKQIPVTLPEPVSTEASGSRHRRTRRAAKEGAEQ